MCITYIWSFSAASRRVCGSSYLEQPSHCFPPAASWTLSPNSCVWAFSWHRVLCLLLNIFPSGFGSTMDFWTLKAVNSFERKRPAWSGIQFEEFSTCYCYMKPPLRKPPFRISVSSDASMARAGSALAGRATLRWPPWFFLRFFSLLLPQSCLSSAAPLLPLLLVGVALQQQIPINLHHGCSASTFCSLYFSITFYLLWFIFNQTIPYYFLGPQKCVWHV